MTLIDFAFYVFPAAAVAATVVLGVRQTRRLRLLTGERGWATALLGLTFMKGRGGHRGPGAEPDITRR